MLYSSSNQTQDRISLLRLSLLLWSKLTHIFEILFLKCLELVPRPIQCLGIKVRLILWELPSW